MESPPQDEEWPFSRTDRPSKIVCIGRNWAEHARELGHDVPDEPILFLKPRSALLPSGAPIRLPRGVGRVDHEIELGVVLGARLTAARAEDAWEAVRGWCLALDLTARDVQTKAKAQGRPWTVAKGRDGFCPVSRLLARGAVDPRNAVLSLRVDGVVRQSGNTRDMLWSVPELLAYVSSVMSLVPGDLVLTGTPPGVGPLVAGVEVEGRLDDVVLLRHPVV